MRIDVYFHHSPGNEGLGLALISIGEQLAGVKRRLKKLEATHREEAARMSQQLEALKEEVARNSSLTDSLRQLVVGLVAKVEELKDDPEALQALVDEVRESNTDLAFAVTTGTGALEPPVEEPPAEEPPAEEPTEPPAEPVSE